MTGERKADKSRPSLPKPPGTFRRFATGMGYLAKGLRLWITSPRLMLLGAIPALIVGAVYVTAIILSAINLDADIEWVTPFTGGWADPWRDVVRILAGVALVAAVVLVAIFTFAAVTLAVGDPFYERIWRSVEEKSGGAPTDLGETFWRGLWRGVGSGFRLFALTALVGILMFALGFIPIVGQTVVPVLGAIVGGWFLALELSGFAFDARGLRLRDRRRVLGTNRAASLGFGVLTYLLFLIPLAAVVIMPAAVAGATMLSRDTLESQKTAADDSRPT